MLMAMVSKTTSQELDKSLIDSIFQTTSSQLRTSTTPSTEISQVMLEKLNMKEDQITDPHTSTQSSVMANTEPTPDSTQEVTVATKMSSTKTVLCKDPLSMCQKSTK